MEQKDTRKIKILFLFAIVALGFIIFLCTLFYWAQIDRRLPRLTYQEHIHATRGNIISSDNFKVATSKKLYKAVIDTRNIDPDKLDLFVNLYSLYSGDKNSKIKKRILSHKGSLVLSYKINSKSAKHLQTLSRKLFRLGVFRTYEDPKTGVTFLHGMNVSESGERRVYPASNTLTPIVGYVKKIEKNGITKVTGVKGLERYYEDRLLAIQDSLTVGNRDISNSIILNRDSVSSRRINGFDIHTTISLKLQKMIEDVLDQYKKSLDAKEIIVSVMHSKTGALLALASSNRYNPDFIKRSDYPNLNVSAVEYSYEPGSVMKSITFALLLKEKKVNPYDLVRTYGGKYKLGKRTIRDTHDFEWLSAEDVIVHSSNIGILQLAQKLDAIEFYQGLKDFGFSGKSYIDLPYEKMGSIPPLYKFKSETYKATVGYGYGMTATFMQVLKAYNVFNNNGRMITPYIASYFEDQDGKKYSIPRRGEKEIIPISVAKRMKSILIKTVQKGTGVKAQVEGIQVGGKTGTAHIAEDGKYIRQYNSSFFGFANDKKNRFTIGVLVVRPKKKYQYFAATSAVPIFKEIVLRLIEEKYLTPESINQVKQ
ncbi:peptidoglycan D,D-transpeptidase FtsI family protein [Sulfurospirillum arcachonense]|uniref:peptidoglycan D,D-transpeptidase FtsI family protein n=1 Tax=Sulfurospirillum arcachonense TaxID=57666 RepID=UPI000469DB5E|nr:penicillin-binding protein 2 [Sulfurospirillum arcachonense]